MRYARAVLFACVVGLAQPALAEKTSVKCSNGTVTVGGGAGGSCVRRGTAIVCDNAGGKSVASGGCDTAGKATCNDTKAGGTCEISIKSKFPQTAHPTKLHR